MHGTRHHGHHRRPGWEAPAGPMYWGWSPASGQMELMDLRNYVDALRDGYDRALEDLYDRLTAVPGMVAGAQPYTVPLPPPWTGGPGRGRGRGKGHHRHHGHGGCGDHHEGCGEAHHGHGHGDHGKGHDRHGCGHDHGCGKEDDCRCECCIVDADVVVYARCGERRVVPIEIENETRKDREDVTLEVSDVRSSGGNRLPWQAALTPKGPITIKGCTTAKLELLVAVHCDAQAGDDKGDDKGNDRGDTKAAPAPTQRRAKAAPEAVAGDELRLAVSRSLDTGNVDSCTVGYVTVSVGGCLVRPIVVAVAVLPDDCGAYRAGCPSCC